MSWAIISNLGGTNTDDMMVRTGATGSKTNPSIAR